MSRFLLFLMTLLPINVHSNEVDYYKGIYCPSLIGIDQIEIAVDIDSRKSSGKNLKKNKMVNLISEEVSRVNLKIAALTLKNRNIPRLIYQFDISDALDHKCNVFRSRLVLKQIVDLSRVRKDVDTIIWECPFSDSDSGEITEKVVMGDLHIALLFFLCDFSKTNQVKILGGDPYVLPKERRIHGPEKDELFETASPSMGPKSNSDE
jgi:hypothetical protein